jgi:hypothetical protein
MLFRLGRGIALCARRLRAVGAALARAIAPPSKPVNAAAISKGLFDVFIVSSPNYLPRPGNLWVVLVSNDLRDVLRSAY